MWNGVLHGCYNGSRALTAVVAFMNYVHKILGTYQRVTYYIALTEFGKSLFIKAGIPGEKIFIKPNFLFDLVKPNFHHQGYALYLGRVSHEKGVRTLLHAWTHLENRVPLKIVGGGYDLGRND